MSDTVDLFQNVISLSGYYVWNPKETALDNTQLLIDYLNLSEDEVVPALTSMSYEELYNASTAAGCSWDYASYGTSTMVFIVYVYTVKLFQNSFLKRHEGVLNPYCSR